MDLDCERAKQKWGNRRETLAASRLTGAKVKSLMIEMKQNKPEPNSLGADSFRET